MVVDLHSGLPQRRNGKLEAENQFFKPGFSTFGPHFFLQSFESEVCFVNHWHLNEILFRKSCVVCFSDDTTCISFQAPLHCNFAQIRKAKCRFSSLFSQAFFFPASLFYSFYVLLFFPDRIIALSFCIVYVFGNLCCKFLDCANDKSLPTVNCQLYRDVIVFVHAQSI